MYSSGNVETKEEQVVDEPAKEVMGFLIGEDVREGKPEGFTVQEEAPKENRSFVPKQSRVPNVFASIMAWITSVRLPSFGRKPNMARIGLGIAIILFLGLLCFGFEYFFHKASVSIVIPSVSLEKQFTLKGSTTREEGYLPIKVSTSSATASETKSTNGKVDVGDKAKGEVTFYNFDDKERTISKGTTLKVDAHAYVTDDATTVGASSIATDGSAKLPGKSKARVTATDIGTEQNLEKSQRLTVGDISSSVVFAMNEAAISGGTRKTVRTVSKKDIEDLQAAILAKSKAQEQEKFKSTLTGEVAAIDSLMSVRLTNVKQTREVGEEGDTVTVKATVLAQYYFYSIEDMKKYLAERLAGEVPSGYALPLPAIGYELKTAKQADGYINLSVAATARATKRVDLYKLRQGLLGKGRVQAVEEATSRFGLTSADIVITPSLPLLTDRLPFIIKNITVTNSNP